MDNTKKYIAITVIIGALVGSSNFFGLFSGLENFFSDRLFFKKPVHPDIVIVEIDSESINKIGQWPWERKVFAKFIENLKKYNPKALAVDVVFSENSRFGKLDDRALSESIKSAGFPIILPVEVLNSNTLLPLSEFYENKNAHLAHVNIILDKDGVARKLPTKIENWNPFGLEITDIIGTISEKSQNSEKIVYASPAKSIRRIPFWRVLDNEKIENFENKIIFVGATSPDLHDEFETPFSNGGKMPGVEIQANITNMFLNGYSLNSLHNFIMFSWIVASALSSYAGVLHIVPAILLFEKGFSANLVHLNLSWIFSSITFFSFKYLTQRKEKKKIKNIFGKYVSKDVLAEILKNPNKAGLGGEEKEITVLFSDIRGFTSFSEKTNPTQLVDFLNEYFSEMTETVIKNEGTLDKYIGDAIMAFWGAPIENKNQADLALNAAIEMIRKLEKFPELKIGIGIHTGKAVVGNIGSSDRIQYTAIGDTVNIASRLEGLNKNFGTQIIISENTKSKLANNYQLKNLGIVYVKGREEKINIYSNESTH